MILLIALLLWMLPALVTMQAPIGVIMRWAAFIIVLILLFAPLLPADSAMWRPIR